MLNILLSLVQHLSIKYSQFENNAFEIPIPTILVSWLNNQVHLVLTFSWTMLMHMHIDGKFEAGHHFKVMYSTFLSIQISIGKCLFQHFLKTCS